MKKRQQAFTLIEMLLSMAIMTAVISLASYSYRFYSDLSQQNSLKYESTLRQMQAWQRVRERVSETVDYYVKPIYRPLPTDIPLFIGKERVLFGVTDRGLFNSKRQALYWLGVKQGKLLYCEKPIDGYIPTEDEVANDICDTSLVVQTSVEQIRFRYYGWRGLSDKVLSNSIEATPDISQVYGWYQTYEGRQRFLLPDWLEVLITSREERSPLPERTMIKLHNHDPDRLSYFLESSHDES